MSDTMLTESMPSPATAEIPQEEESLDKRGPLFPVWQIAPVIVAETIVQEQEQRVGGERPHPGGFQQKYYLNEEGRTLIKTHYDSQTKTIDWLVEQLSSPENPIPRWQITKWAQELGVTRTKELPWSEAEISYLRNCLRHKGLKGIAKDLGRSEIAIKLKAQRLGIRKLVTGDGYTMRSLERGLGVDHHQVERWMQQGWFTGERRESRRHGGQRGDIWYFTATAIRELVRRHPEEIDRRRVDWTWLIDVLLGPADTEVGQGPALPLPPRPGKSAYAYMSDEAHTVITTYYTGAIKRTEAIAELLGVTPNEIITWAVLLGLERAAMHRPRVHEQSRRKTDTTTTSPQLTPYLRQMLEERFTGDPGATEALADDLDLSIEEVEFLAREARILSSSEKRGESKKASTPPEERKIVYDIHQHTPAKPIPLTVQVLLATRYNDEPGTIETLIEEIARRLEENEGSPTADQVQQWAKRLGLRTRQRRLPPSTPEKGRNGRSSIPPFLYLDPHEWDRILSPQAKQWLRLASAALPLPTAQEIQLGYLLNRGTQEKSRPPDQQDPAIIEDAGQAKAQLTEVLLPLVTVEAMRRLGQGVALEALLEAGGRGLEQGIETFDYIGTTPLVSHVLPLIRQQIGQLAGQLPTSLSSFARSKEARLFARIVAVSHQLAKAGSSSTVQSIAEVLSLSDDLIGQTIAYIVQAQSQEKPQKGRPAPKGRPQRVSDEQLIAAFMKTQAYGTRAIIQELAAVLPLTPLTIQSKFYALNLRDRLSEREYAVEQARTQRIQQWKEAKKAASHRLLEERLLLEHGNVLWNATVNGEQRRWALRIPYGELAEQVPIGAHILFAERSYLVERVYYSQLVVTTVPD